MSAARFSRLRVMNAKVMLINSAHAATNRYLNLTESPARAVVRFVKTTGDKNAPMLGATLMAIDVAKVEDEGSTLRDMANIHCGISILIDVPVTSEPRKMRKDVAEEADDRKAGKNNKKCGGDHSVF